MILRVISALFLCSLIAFGQLTPNSVTVTATRLLDVQPDELVFAIMVDSRLEASREDAIAAVQGVGITSRNFSGVSTVQEYDEAMRTIVTLLRWTFTLPVAFANMKSTVAMLTAVQSSAMKNNGVKIHFMVQGSRVSAQAAKSCSSEDLLSDARAKALKIAGATGKGLGAVLAISGTTSGDSSAAYAYNPGCSVTVKFALTGF